VPDEKPYSELIPPHGDKRVGEVVVRMWGEILKDKLALGLHARWLRNHQLRRNKHWKNKAKNVPQLSANLIDTHVTRTTNTLTDNNPTFNVSRLQDDPSTKMDDQAFEDMQKGCGYWWNETEQQEIFEESVLNGETYGITIEGMTFNDGINNGLGDAETILIDPFCFGWYPVDSVKTARELQKADALLYVEPITVREARRRWPDNKDEIKPDSEALKDLGDERRDATTGAQRGQNQILQVVNEIKQYVASLFGSKEGEMEDRCLVYHCFVKDYSRATTKEEESEDGFEVRVETEPTYPGHIRYVVVTNGGKIVLEDRKNPSINWKTLKPEQARITYLYDKFPITAANSNKDTSNGWGWSDIEQLEFLNLELDKALTQFTLMKDKAARSKLIVPRDTGIQDHELSNMPGILRPASSQASAGIRWLEAPPQVLDIEKAIELFKSLFFLKAGSFELDQGKVQGTEVVAYKAIAALLEHAATMQRGKIRAYSRLIRERGRMYLSMKMNYGTEDEWITVPDSKGGTETKSINWRKMLAPANLTVVTGSTMPVSKVQQREEALALRKMGVVDNEEILRKFEWNNVESIIERMKAGPYADLFDRLQKAGMPQQILQLIVGISQMDPKTFEKQEKAGKVPNFGQVFQDMMRILNGEQVENPEQVMQQAEQLVKQAQADKFKADAMLTMEKIVSERIDQQVKAAGVAFDEESLKMQRAKLVSEIQQGIKELKIEGLSQIASMLQNSPGYNEQGMKSNNRGE
jgi:hypothetical protein